MNTKTKRIICVILALLMLGTLAVSAFADDEQSRTVIGADLSTSQVEEVYRMFGIERGSVRELTVTNAEERAYLENYVDSSVIGTYSISCVYVELLTEGSGIEVSTSNIGWCTEEMYRNALTTAGVNDAKIVVAAPVLVSGTAALTGVYKAYEDLTGQKLDAVAKIVGTQELTITGELAEEIGNIDASAIVNDLKMVLDETSTMSDEQLKAEIVSIAEQYGVQLTDSQMNQLIDLCRSLEGLNVSDLQKRIEDVQNAITKLNETKEQVSGFVQKVVNFVNSVASFFDKVASFFGK